MKFDADCLRNAFVAAGGSVIFPKAFCIIARVRRLFGEIKIPVAEIVLVKFVDSAFQVIKVVARRVFGRDGKIYFQRIDCFLAKSNFVKSSEIEKKQKFGFKKVLKSGIKCGATEFSIKRTKNAIKLLQVIYSNFHVTDFNTVRISYLFKILSVSLKSVNKGHYLTGTMFAQFMANDC